MEEAETVNPWNPKCQELIAAYLAMEPIDCLISLAQEFGGGSITKGVQSFILEQCVNSSVSRRLEPTNLYIKNLLKKVILSVESSHHDVLDGLYEQYVHLMTSHKEYPLVEEHRRVHKSISFLFPAGGSDDHGSRQKVVVPLQCSVNMLEGDTGCSIWPSGLFLSEFILSYPEIFSNNSCFELGSGVGLVGVSLTYANPSKVILSDGDLSTLGNMKHNLELNHLKIECKYLPWESASEAELHDIKPDIVVGADLIYDPTCIPHLVKVLAILLSTNEFKPNQLTEGHGVDLIGNKMGQENSDAYELIDQNRHTECLSEIHCHGNERMRNSCSPVDATFQCKKSKEVDSMPDLQKGSYENGHVISDNGALSGAPVIKQGPVAYMATVIRNSNTFDYFLRSAATANLSVVNITETRKPLNLLPYMRSYDRSSIRLYAVFFSCN